MTGSEFDALPYDEGRRWELLDGSVIEIPNPTPQHQGIVANVLFALSPYLDARGGACFMAVEFALSAMLRLRPDACVFLVEKARSLDYDLIPVPGAPDLAIEVISPEDRASESQEKLTAYLRNGTAEVWQIFPTSRTVMINRSERGRTLEANQTLTSPLLPQFELTVQALFE